MTNKNTAIIGAFFGDEAKARITNYLAKDYRFVVRFNGSSNSGHTLYYNNKKIVRHLLPSADFSQPDNYAFLSSNMVINPDDLLKEIQETCTTFPNAASRIIIDPNAFVITKEHLEEDKQNVIKLGSTGKGVGCAYRDKVNRTGTRIIDLLKDNNDVIMAIKNTGAIFRSALSYYDEFKNSSILFEGAQSVLLDINFGTYPFVTSSECTLGGILNSGFASFMPSNVYGITKAYSTRVGSGPFPTELFGDEAENLRKIGKEYGATTGRPRRVGWLDLAALKYAKKLCGFTDLVVTKLDILDGLNEVPVCVNYEELPTSPSDFFETKTEMTLLPGWQNSRDIKQITPFINFVSEYVDCPIKYVSFGVNDDDIISWN
jgi:adenylosuccinate synthase